VVAPGTLSTGGAESISRLATGLAGLPLMGGHRLQLLADSESIMRALIADIDAARSRCTWSSTSGAPAVSSTTWWRRWSTPRARRHCRALMDSLGSRSFFRSEAIEALRAAGVEVVEVLPVNPLRALFVRLDLRDHRKIAVIDRASPTPAA
jgi:cardiolipin synthase